MRALLPLLVATAMVVSTARPLHALTDPDAPQPTRSVVYKQASGVDLALEVFDPAGLKDGDARPGIVFFFGGGWLNGSPEQFYRQCAALSARGMVALSADYRVQNKEHTSPKESLADAKSALRWVQAHAKELHIDPKRLAAGGGSAGGHLAIAADIIPGYDEPGESAPITLAALVLYNPVIDNGPGGYGYDRVKDYYKDFSPMHNLKAGMPPTLLMFGTKDKYVPVATAQKFQEDMEALGNRCDLHFYPDQAHGFFNFNKPVGNPYYNQTLDEVMHFLESVGLLEPLPRKGLMRYRRETGDPMFDCIRSGPLTETR